MQKYSSTSSVATSSASSFNHTPEYGDELESYLSLLAASNSETKNKTKVDWEKVLDKQYQEHISTAVDVENEINAKNECNNIQTTQFLKPLETKVAAANNSSSNHDNTELNQLDSTHLSVAGAVNSVNVDSSSNTDSYTEFNDTKSGSVSPSPDSDLGRKKLESSFTKPTEQSSTHIKSQRPVDTSEDTSSTSSLSQDLLALSSHFKNNIFTVDQLGPIDSDNDDNTHTTSVTENPQLKNVISLADIESLEHKEKTVFLQDNELQENISEMSNEIKPDNFNDERLCVDHHQTTSSDNSEERSSAIEEESVNYEEDFESEPTHTDISVQGPNSTLNNSHTANHDDITRSQVTPDTRSYCSSTQSIDQNNAVIQNSHQLTQNAADFNDNDDLVHRTGSKEQNIHTPKENVRDATPEVHSSGVNQNGHPLQTPSHLSYFQSIPHIPQLHPTPTTGVPSLVTETLEDLLHSQLTLTRALVTHSRSLAQHFSDSITSNYHYTTLEDTKKYISRHRPKVLTTKEAQKLVSQEDKIQ